MQPSPYGYSPPPAQAYARPPVQTTAPSPDAKRRSQGLIVYVLAMLIGGVLNLAFQTMVIFDAKDPARMFNAVLEGALFAFIPLGVYLFVPAIVDRYDPEPWWCLAMAFFWGAIVAIGVAGFVNTGVHIAVAAALGPKAGQFVTLVISAPFCEEFMKGMAVFLAFHYLRREFDGVVDGIIYATFCALGFAAVENVLYYARADLAGGIGVSFALRGILSPWGHPLYTSMTGIGFGIARETDKKWLRWTAPFAGYFVGVTLHAIWNGSAFFLGGASLLLLPLWFLFVAAFFVLIVVLVVRKGRIIRDYLKDEVVLGTITKEELDLIVSPVGVLQCRFSWRGKPGRELIRAGARLALSKWHTARAMRGHKRTISADFIGPMRQAIYRARQEMWQRAPR